MANNRIIDVGVNIGVITENFNKELNEANIGINKLEQTLTSASSTTKSFNSSLNKTSTEFKLMSNSAQLTGKELLNVSNHSKSVKNAIDGINGRSLITTAYDASKLDNSLDGISKSAKDAADALARVKADMKSAQLTFTVGGSIDKTVTSEKGGDMNRLRKGDLGSLRGLFSEATASADNFFKSIKEGSFDFLQLVDSVSSYVTATKTATIQNAKLKDSTEAYEKLSTELDVAKNAAKDLDQSYNKLTDELIDANKQYDDAKEQVMQLAGAIDTLKKQLNSMSGDTSSHEKTIETYEEALHKWNATVSKSTNSIQELKTAIADNRSEFNKHNDEITDSESKMSDLKSEILSLGGKFNEMGQVIPVVGGAFSSLGGAITSIIGGARAALASLTGFAAANPIIAGILAIVGALAGLASISSSAYEEFKKLKIFNLTAQEMGFASSIAEKYGADLQDVGKAARAMSQAFGETDLDALQTINAYLKEGADPQNLDWLQEYATNAKDMGLSMEEFAKFSLEAQKQGVFNDKYLDLLKEFSIKFKNLNDAGKDAMTDIGVDWEQMTKKLNDGSISGYEALDIVLERINEVGPATERGAEAIQQLGAALGEDIGAEGINRFRTALNAAITDVGDMKEETVGWIGGQELLNQELIKLGQDVMPIINAAFDVLKGIVGGVLWTINKIIEGIKYVANIGSKLFPDTIKPAGNALPTVDQSVKASANITTNIPAQTTAEIKAAEELAKQVAAAKQKAYEEALKAASLRGDAAIFEIDRLFELDKQQTQDAADMLTKSFKEVVDIVKEQGKEIFADINSIIYDAMSSEEDEVAIGEPLITDKIAQITAYADAISGIGQAWQGVANAEKVTLAGLLNATGQTIAQMITMFQALVAAKIIAAESSKGLIGVLTAAGAITTALGMFASFTKFAEGGIVMPTTGGTKMMVNGLPSIVGEAGQPEAIIPLNRLKGMIGGGQGPMELTTRISGRDLEIVLSRQGRFNQM